MRLPTRLDSDALSPNDGRVGFDINVTHPRNELNAYIACRHCRVVDKVARMLQVNSNRTGTPNGAHNDAPNIT